jgi:hypothetical protein
MFAALLSQIDVLDRRLNASDHGFANGFRRRRNCDDRSVMVGVHFASQKVNVTG